VLLQCLIIACLLLNPLILTALDQDNDQGYLEGHLHIFSPQTVDLPDGKPATVTPEIYAEYPLVVMTVDGRKQVATVTAGASGNYRVALAPGDYVLDIKDRARKHVRAKPQRFTIVSKQAVRADMNLDTGVR